MNEIQLLQQQLSMERRHCTEVVGASAAVLSTGPKSDAFRTACAEYLTFALRRSESASTREALEQLKAASNVPDRWKACIETVAAQASEHFRVLDSLIGRDLPVSRWRALAGVDADSILEERRRFEQVRSQVPAEVALSSKP